MVGPPSERIARVAGRTDPSPMPEGALRIEIGGMKVLCTRNI
jgi:hypothetical protein